MPRFASVPEIENEARIAHDFASEAGRRNLSFLQEFLNSSKKMHHISPDFLATRQAGTIPTAFLLV